jgi:hypothetical protein
MPMAFDQITEKERAFLLQLYRATEGDLGRQVSMHDIGSELGFDKSEASRLTEALIGWQMVEIRTLSGGIGITAEGIEEIKSHGLADTQEAATVRLGENPLLDSKALPAVEQLVDELKEQAGRIGLGFAALTELMADLKTIESQLESSRPKTAIVRECFRSLLKVLEAAGAAQSAVRVTALLGE